MSGIIPICLLALAAVTITAPTASATEVIDRRDGEPGRFPVIESESLRGRTIRLPDQLKGERNLLIVAYEREQQADIDTWLAVLDTFSVKEPAFAYYELPSLSGSYKWMRAVIDGGMKQGIPDRAQRDRTITLYLDVEWFRAQIGTADEPGIAALLVDREGTILARWYGRYSDEAGGQLRPFLTAN
jgi:hypothetical protein